MATRTKSKSTKSGTRRSTSAGPRRSRSAAARTTAATVADAEPDTPTQDNSATTTDQAAMAADKPDSDSSGDDRLRRPDLIEAVSARVSMKRSEAKMVIDVMLDELGKALDGADEIVVPPLGKLMVKKRMEKPNGAMLTVKLKRAEKAPEAGDVAPLANPDEGS